MTKKLIAIIFSVLLASSAFAQPGEMVDHSKAMKWLKEINEALDWNAKHRMAEAVVHVDAALEIAKEIFPVELPYLANTETWAGRFHAGNGEYKKGEELLYSAIGHIESVQGVDHLDLISPLNDLGRIYINTGREQDAAKVLERAVGIHEKAYADNYENIINHWRQMEEDMVSFENLELEEEGGAQLLRDMAVLTQRMALEQGKQYAHEYGRTMNRLQALYRKLEQYDDAAVSCARTVEFFGKLYTFDHDFVESISRECGEIERLRGDKEKAIEWYGKVLDIMERKYGPKNLKSAGILESLITLNRQIGDEGKAEDFQAKLNTIRGK